MGMEFIKSIVIDKMRCDQCGICVDFCPVKVFRKEGGVIKITKLNVCYACETCKDLCPKEAIHIVLK